MTTEPTQEKKVSVSFALQGGGQLGAYQLGIICAFLKDPRIGEIQGLSGASAGGLNSYFTAMILMMGLRDRADEIGRECWPALSVIPTNTEEVVGWLKDTLFGKNGTLRATADWFFSPLTKYIDNGTVHQIESLSNIAFLGPLLIAMPEKHKFNLFKILLGDKLEKMIDFEKMRTSKGPELHVAGASITSDSAVLYERKHASGIVGMITSAVPFIFPSIHYMLGTADHTLVDGAMAANPPIAPHVHRGGDCIVIKLMDAPEDAYPKAFQSSVHILRMLKDAGMNHEIRGAIHINQIIEDSEKAGTGSAIKDKKCFFHMLSDEHIVRKYGLSSALNFNAGLARQMFDEGFKDGQKWLEQNFDKLGKHSTFIPPSLDPDDYENGLPQALPQHPHPHAPQP